MTRICCLVFARLASTRVPNKLLQEVGGRTLLSRGLAYLHELRQACPNVTPIVCSPGREIQFDGVDVETLDDTAQTSSWPSLIAPHVEMLRERFDVVWDANIFCHPFLRVETGRRIVNEIDKYGGGFVAVHRKRGIVWNHRMTEVVGEGQLANTKTNEAYYELAHVAYVWEADQLDWTTERLAAEVVPREFPLHWSELIDIDTPEDLEHARAVAKGAGL